MGRRGREKLGERGREDEMRDKLWKRERDWQREKQGDSEGGREGGGTPRFHVCLRVFGSHVTSDPPLRAHLNLERWLLSGPRTATPEPQDRRTSPRPGPCLCRSVRVNLGPQALISFVSYN